MRDREDTRATIAVVQIEVVAIVLRHGVGRRTILIADFYLCM